MSKARAKKIKIILFDVDGVLTDGTIWLFPAPAGSRQQQRGEIEKMADAGGFAISSNDFVEAKGFNAHDGTAFSLARLAGLKTGVITKRISETVALRARDLKLDYVYQGQDNKLEAFHKIIDAAGVTAAEVAFVGDDIVDLPVLRKCGLAIAVRNSRKCVKDEAHFITENEGGSGAARDAVEYILSAQGQLKQAVEQYLAARTSAKGKSIK